MDMSVDSNFFKTNIGKTTVVVESLFNFQLFFSRRGKLKGQHIEEQQSLKSEC